jgi:molybdate transport system permease protein
MIASALFILIIIIPIIAVLVSVSPSELVIRLTTPAVVDSLKLSLLASTVSTVFVLILATPISYALARYNFRGRWLLDAIVDIPMILPPAVAGLALLLAFAPRGLVGSALASRGFILPGSMWAVVMAEIFVSSPFYIRASKAAFSGVNQRIIDSARILSASDANVFLKVTLPLAWKGVFAGLVMCWARSLGEFGATLMFAGNLPGVTQTMPLAIYVALSSDLQAAVVLSVIMILFSFILLAVVKYLGGQKVF